MWEKKYNEIKQTNKTVEWMPIKRFVLIKFVVEFLWSDYEWKSVCKRFLCDFCGIENKFESEHFRCSKSTGI